MNRDRPVKPLGKALGGAIAAGTLIGLAAGCASHSDTPTAATHTAATCWARGTGVTIRTVGAPDACLDPGKWTGPVEGLPYMAVTAIAGLGLPVCTAQDRGTVWTVWATSDLLAAQDLCGDVGGSPPGETP